LAERKTRFMARASSHQAELLSVRERSNGDLLIAQKRNAYHETLAEPFVAISEQHYSVHVSPNSSGNVITYTRKVNGDETKRHRQLVECDKRTLLWPLFTSRYADLSHPIFRAKSRAQDNVSCTSDFDASRNNLVLHLVIGAARSLQEFLVLGQFSSKAVSFTHFDVMLLWSFMPLASLVKGDTAMISFDHDRVESLPPDMLFVSIMEMEQQITDQMIKRANQEFERHRRVMTEAEKLEIEQRCQMRSPDPY
jgi:hypothetical protein